MTQDAIKPHIYCFSGSPYTWRVLIALEEKGVEYDAEYLERMGGLHRTDEMMARNPRGRLPIYTHGDDVMYESLAIVQFIDLAYPQSPLLPVSPGGRARALMRVHELPYLGAVFDAVAGLLMVTKAADRDPEEAKKVMASFYAELDRWEAYLEGDYLAGDTFSIADIALLPVLAFLVRVGFDPAANGLPRLAAYHARLMERPAIEVSSPPHWRDGAGSDVGFAEYAR